MLKILQMPANYVFIFFESFILSVLLITLLKKVTLNKNLFYSKGMPIFGGMAIGLSFIIVVLFNFKNNIFSGDLNGILISGIIMLAFGVIDDLREFSIISKFLAHLAVTSFLILFGIRTHIINIGHVPNIIITIVWVIGITNAFNHLDVMDGLAGGVALIISFSFFIISVLNQDIKNAILSLSLTGGISAFLIYNLPPANIYMGNSGSHFLGFILSVIAINISYAPLERKIALFSPLLIMGLPLFDTAFLIVMRISKKILPFMKSNDHMALKFLTLGYSKKKSLYVMLFLCLFFSLCGILISQVSNFLGVVIITLASLVSLIISFRFSKVPING